MSRKRAAAEMPGLPPGAEEFERQARERRRRTARAVSALTAVVVVTIFVVQNSQAVTVRFWFFTGHPHLIYVVLACLVAGVVVGYLTSRTRRRPRRKGKKAEGAGPAR